MKFKYFENQLNLLWKLKFQTVNTIYTCYIQNID